MDQADIDDRGGGPDSSLRRFASCSSVSEKWLLMIPPCRAQTHKKIKRVFMDHNTKSKDVSRKLGDKHGALQKERDRLVKTFSHWGETTC
jgi:hypothetical protein